MKRTFLFLAIGVTALAAKWTVDDVLTAEHAGDMQISRDGKLAVWTKASMDKEKGEAVSNLVLRYLDAEYDVPLTRGTDTNNSPRFSPDGKRIAFLSSRKPQPPSAAPQSAAPAPAPEGSQVWIIDVRGGEPWPATKFDRSVRAVAWLDNDTLLLAALED